MTKVLKLLNTNIYLANLLILFLIIVLLAVTVFYGCRKKEIGEYLLGDLKNQNPFDGYETLIFVNNSGDSIVFFGNGRYSEIFHTKPNSDYDRYYVNERDLCSFIEKDNNYEITIDLQTHLSDISQMDLHFVETIHLDDATCTYYTTSFNKLPLSHLPWQKGHYIDSLIVLNRYYYDVYADSSLLTQGSGSYNCSSQNKVTTMFYTTTHGIIKIVFEDSTSWGLKEVIP